MQYQLLLHRYYSFFSFTDGKFSKIHRSSRKTKIADAYSLLFASVKRENRFSRCNFALLHRN